MSINIILIFKPTSFESRFCSTTLAVVEFTWC